MTKDNIRHSIRNHIVEQWLNGDDRGFDDDADLQQAGVFDSFTTLALVAYLDEAFNAEISPVEINSETFRTVNSVTDLVASKLKLA